jgi:hypothetical protein
VAVQIKTGRGIYDLSSAAPLEINTGGVALTLAMARADGVERVVFRCHIARILFGSGNTTDADALIACLQPWIEREFEQTREAALKSIRTERKLFELAFDRERPGPFTPA